MGQLIARYLVLAIAVVVLNFLLPRLLPGDPLEAAAPDGLAAGGPVLTIQQRAQLRAEYRLDQPLASQFLGYVSDLGRGDLGWSLSKSAPVSRLITDRLPWTLALVGTGVAVAAVGGSALGVLIAWRGERIDVLLVGGLAALSALPEFLVAVSLLLVFAVWAGWFPLQGGRTPFVDAPLWTPAGAADIAWHLALPALALVIASTPAFALVARGAMRTVVAERYLATARAKGLDECTVALRHAVPNAALPMLTLLAVRAGHALGGVVLVERVFALPGLGLLAFEAVGARDYPVIQAVFLLGSLGVLLAMVALEVVVRVWSAHAAT
jgi:peptide/nickel transport system permease protein